MISAELRRNSYLEGMMYPIAFQHINEEQFMDRVELAFVNENWGYYNCWNIGGHVPTTPRVNWRDFPYPGFTIEGKDIKVPKGERID